MTDRATIRRIVRDEEPDQAGAVEQAAPIVKWAGGKTKLLPELLRRVPRSFCNYHEPFAGGLALFWKIQPSTGYMSYLNDSNEDLINLYRVVKTFPQRLIEKLWRHRRAHGKDYFHALRDRFNGAARPYILGDVDRAAAFMYFNKTCFNGLWRVNAKGRFNVSFGDYKDPNICDPPAIRAASRAFSNVVLTSGDYRIVCHAQVGDFVYFDPPYDPVSETANFVSYGADRFGKDDQKVLADIAGELVDRGVQVMLSNSNTKLIRKLYSHKRFTIARVKCPRMINSDATKRGDVVELVITGGIRR